MKRAAAIGVVCLLATGGLAHAEDLYHNESWANVASDQRARAVGDVLTVVVYQNAEAHDAAANTGHKRQSLDGSFQSNNQSQQGGALALDGAYAGQGEMSRSQSFITQISVTVTGLTSNGDLIVAGDQQLNFNGERTTIRVRGRVRQSDINSVNAVLSTRLADAEIDYNGRGFVSRNAGPGIVQRLFALLGLGG